MQYVARTNDYLNVAILLRFLRRQTASRDFFVNVALMWASCSSVKAVRAPPRVFSRGAVFLATLCYAHSKDTVGN
jgi:hypothetical protein